MTNLVDVDIKYNGFSDVDMKGYYEGAHLYTFQAVRCNGKSLEGNLLVNRIEFDLNPLFVYVPVIDIVFRCMSDKGEFAVMTIQGVKILSNITKLSARADEILTKEVYSFKADKINPWVTVY